MMQHSFHIDREIWIYLWLLYKKSSWLLWLLCKNYISIRGNVDITRIMVTVVQVNIVVGPILLYPNFDLLFQM